MQSIKEIRNAAARGYIDDPGRIESIVERTVNMPAGKVDSVK